MMRVPDGWSAARLEDCVAALIDYRGKSPAKTDRGIPLITAKIVKGGRILEADEFISENDYTDWMRRGLPRVKDVVVTTEAPLGEVGQLTTDRVALAQRLILLRGQDGILDSTFLKFAMQSAVVQEQLHAKSTGTTVLGIRQSELRNVVIPLPPIAEQNRIANILGTLDDKINLNRRMNEASEAIARALFDELLARSKRGTPGWTQLPLGSYVSLHRGTTYKSSLKGLTGPYLLGLGSIRRNGGFRGEKLETYGGDSPDSLLLRPGDMYVSLKDVTQSGDLLGAAARVPASVALGRLTQDTVKLVPIAADAPMQIIYRTLLSESYREYCRAHATGTTNLGLSRDDFLSYPIVCPPDDLRATFDEQVGALNRRMELADQESDTLSQLRDTLLPQLLSGELRVSTAEKQLAHV